MTWLHILFSDFLLGVNPDIQNVQVDLSLFSNYGLGG